MISWLSAKKSINVRTTWMTCVNVGTTWMAVVYCVFSGFWHCCVRLRNGKLGDFQNWYTVIDRWSDNHQPINRLIIVSILSTHVTVLCQHKVSNSFNQIFVDGRLYPKPAEFLKWNLPFSDLPIIYI